MAKNKKSKSSNSCKDCKNNTNSCLCFLTTTKHIIISYKGNVPFVQRQCTFSTTPMYD